jgi:catechol 2,3-dioxygenase-like lactoylglutathione lyase family enzyme
MLKAQTAFSGISVDDLAKAKQFYTETLGLELTSEGMGLNLDLPGGGSLFIYAKNNHHPASFTILNFVVDDIDEAVDELSRAGVMFERYDSDDMHQDGSGVARGISANQGPDIAWFKDPAGNILSILQPSN